MRRPLIVINWKMAMTLQETRDYVVRFKALDRGRALGLDLVICPPATALTTLSEIAPQAAIQVGAQNLSAEDDPAHTGQLSGRLLYDAGARWVIIAHWELRRDHCETWEALNQKVHQALTAGLRPILLIGEDHPNAAVAPQIKTRLAEILKGCAPQDVRHMAFIYEPTWAIGQARPAPAEWVESGALMLRMALTDQFGESARDVQVIYGGSVSPDYAKTLLSLQMLDGLGMGRKGRDPQATAELVKLVLQYRS